MAEEIVYRHNMDRSPTQEERMNMVGFEGFAEKLIEKGWVFRDEMLTSLKDFSVKYDGVSEGSNHYIEWKAILNPVQTLAN